MKNKEFITELANRMGWSPKEVTELMATFSSVLSSRLVDNDSVYLHGFGQFEVKKKLERVTVNPVNGKRYLVPPKLVAIFVALIISFPWIMSKLNTFTINLFLNLPEYIR